MLPRSAEIQSIDYRVHLRVDEPRGYEPEIEGSSWLELTGTMDEPVRDINSVVFSIHPTDRTEPGRKMPRSVGAIIQIRPNLLAVLGFPHADFDRIWSLALSGQLKYGHLTFTKPHYSKALIVNASFSTNPEE